MGYNTMTKHDLTDYVTLVQYANAHDLGDEWRRAARRAARRASKRNETVGDITQILGKWAIPLDAPVPELPETKTRGVSRDDGRRPYRVFATDAERDAIANVVGTDNVVNPRIARAERRKRKRAERDANATDNGNDA